MAVFVHFEVMCFVNSGIKRDCQLKNVYCLLCFVNYHYVWFFRCNTEVGRNCAIGRCGETWDVTVDCVRSFVEELDDVVENIVVPPGVPALVEKGVTAVEDVIGGVSVATVGT